MGRAVQAQMPRTMRILFLPLLVVATTISIVDAATCVVQLEGRQEAAGLDDLEPGASVICSVDSTSETLTLTAASGLPERALVQGCVRASCIRKSR